MYEENSDFSEKKTNRRAKNHKLYSLLLSQISSDNFRKHDIQQSRSCPTSPYSSCSSSDHHTLTINPFFSLLPPPPLEFGPRDPCCFLPHNCFLSFQTCLSLGTAILSPLSVRSSITDHRLGFLESVSTKYAMQSGMLLFSVFLFPDRNGEDRSCIHIHNSCILIFEATYRLFLQMEGYRTDFGSHISRGTHSRVVIC